MYVNKHIHTYVAWVHAYRILWVHTNPNTVLYIQKQQFEHVNVAGH